MWYLIAHIIHVSEHHLGVDKDKFLIMAVELNGDPPDNMSEYWKTVPRENIMDHRYKKIQCSIEILYLDPIAFAFDVKKKKTQLGCTKAKLCLRKIFHINRAYTIFMYLLLKCLINSFCDMLVINYLDRAFGNVFWAFIWSDMNSIYSVQCYLVVTSFEGLWVYFTILIIHNTHIMNL